MASERTRSSIMARTTSFSIGAPIPAACERISACCSSARRSGAMDVLASAPKPVDIPYTGRPARSMPSTMDLLAAMASTAGGSSTRGVRAGHGRHVGGPIPVAGR